jgi:hypothetical protein
MQFEYVTSTVSVLANDGIVVHVLNHSSSKEATRVRMYQNTGAGAVQWVIAVVPPQLSTRTR